MPAVPKSAVGYVLNRIGPYYEARGDRGAGAAALREALDLRGPDPVEEHDVALRASLLINSGSGLSISLPPCRWLIQGLLRPARVGLRAAGRGYLAWIVVP